MTKPSFLFRQLLLALSLLIAALPTLSATPQNPEEETWDEIEIMLEVVCLAAEEIGIEENHLFGALAHGLSCSQVAIAHQVRPADLVAALASYEEAWILDQLLEGEISRDEAVEWREETWVDVTWFLHEEDPFGLQDIMWLFDASSDYFEMDLLELLEWSSEGASLASMAEYMEVELEDVAEYAEILLDEELEILVILEEIEEDEAAEWFDWMMEELEGLLHDDELLETLMEELWLEETMMELAELLGSNEEELWQAIEEGQ